MTFPPVPVHPVGACPVCDARRPCPLCASRPGEEHASGCPCWKEKALTLEDENAALSARLSALEEVAEAIERIAEQQPKTLATLRHHGIVFDGPLGNDPKNWQHVAFSIYTDLCEVDTIARAALAGLGADTQESGV